MGKPRSHPRVLRRICAQPWAITEEWLQTILSIAAGTNLSVEAVEAQLGRPLDNTRDVSVRQSIATIPVTGPLVRYADMFSEISGASSIDSLATDLNVALEDPAVAGIILDIDSPGGEVNGTSEFADMVRAASLKKPVVAYISNLGCSAAYWIASAAGEIVVADTAMVGSIGCIMAVDAGEEDDGTATFVSSQSPDKRLHPGSEDGKAKIQSTVDDIAAVFVSAVARNRGVSEDTVLSDFGQGGVFVGQKAVDAGLADRVGSYEDVLTQMAGHAKMTGTPTTTTTVPRADAANSAKDKPPRRSTHMSKTLDWLLGKAEAEGVELDPTELEAAFDPKRGDDVRELATAVAARDAQIEALLAAKAEQDRALAEAAAVQRQHVAAEFARNCVASHRVAPAAAESLTAMAVKMATIDASAPVTEGETTAMDLLREFTASLPSMEGFTTEAIQPEQTAVIANEAKTPGVAGHEETPTDERRKALLAKSTLGRSTLESAGK